MRRVLEKIMLAPQEERLNNIKVLNKVLGTNKPYEYVGVYK